MFVANKLRPDPDNDGWVLGWAVVRPEPWHLIGVYETKEDAEEKAKTVEIDYHVRFGSHRLGSDDFVFCSLKPVR